MKIPKKIERLLDKRERLAYQLVEACAELDNWLESKGADFRDEKIVDSTITGCMIYCEPTTAKKNVRDYIENQLN